MKKLITIAAAIIMLNSLCISAYAQNSDEANVYVTIADEKGSLALAQEKVKVTDIDNDGKLTINDALYSAHQEKYNGGANAGYASGESVYGLSLNKLWGVENGGSYGYYVNHKSPLSLADEVKDGDYINAFIYTDLTAWSDTYCYFDVDTTQVKAGEELELILSANSYDSEYNPITVPVENVTITINGEKTDFTTDKDGKATISIDKEGDNIISATSKSQTLVPPACKVTVLADEAPTTQPTSAPTDNSTEPTSATTSASTSDNIKNNTVTNTTNTSGSSTTASTEVSPATGDNNNMALYIAIAIASMSVIAFAGLKSKSYEK